MLRTLCFVQTCSGHGGVGTNDVWQRLTLRRQERKLWSWYLLINDYCTRATNRNINKERNKNTGWSGTWQQRAFSPGGVWNTNWPRVVYITRWYTKQIGPGVVCYMSDNLVERSQQGPRDCWLKVKKVTTLACYGNITWLIWCCMIRQVTSLRCCKKVPQVTTLG